MKKILVPTDFSPVADNALHYAIEVAAGFKSEIYLYHMYSLDSFNFDGNFPRYDQPYTKKMVREMERTKSKFKEKIRKYGLSMQTFVEEDSISSLFKTKVIMHNIDMIVMGSRGASGMTKLFFGSVAATALDKAIVPVLIVPPDHTFRQLGNIVLAIDQSDIKPNVLSPLLKLALKFGAKVTLLNVRTDSKKRAGIISNLNIDGVETIFRELPMTTGINETIGQFVREEGCDLLCMVRRQKGVFKTLFQKSVTRTQVFSNQVPLLILPEV